MLNACMEVDESTLITDDNGIVHRTQHFLKDRRGRDYFPMEIKMKGEKVFIFDPKVSAWAAYDAEGQRVMTGSASGAWIFVKM